MSQPQQYTNDDADLLDDNDILALNQESDMQEDDLEATSSNGNNNNNDEDDEMLLGGEEDFMDLFDPNNPDLQIVQDQIKAQLTDQNQQLYLSIKEINNDITQLSQKRETTGVELYSMQQTLAKLQEEHERAEDDKKTIQRIKDQAEQKRDEFLATFNERKKELDRHKQSYLKYKAEKDKMAEKLIQVERYNEQIVSDIKVKRRTTYETENQMQKVETSKKRQDLLIDTMNERVKQLQIDISEYEGLLEQQRVETNQAHETLAEALTEMEAMRFEKKQLNQRWKSSLIGMQRRDEALKAIAEGLRKQAEQIKEIENEIEGLRTQIQKERDLHEEHTQQELKVGNQMRHIDSQIQETQETIESKHEQFDHYKRTLDQTEEQTHKERQMSKKILSQIGVVDKENHKMSTAIRQLEDKQLRLISDQTTFLKGKASTMKEIEKTQEQIRNRDVDVAQVENELARIKIDRLQTENHNKALKNILEELEKELRERDKLIENYETEIKKKHLEIEKKQTHLDKLNRELESLTANQQEENYGPLEATIKNLEKEIDSKTRDNEQLKKNWTRNQSELVELMNAVDELENQIKDLHSQNTILTQKKMRLESRTNGEQSEVKELEGSMGSMHIDMTKLNNLIAKNSTLQKDIADENYDMENKILNRLSEREREALELENQIKNTREAKRALLGDLVEVEKQIMYWEKKIDLQKEIQESLDPEVGQEEITKMKKEIHIMEQRLLELKRSKKRKIEEISKSVSKRGIINMKGKAQSQKKVDTQASVKKEVSRLMAALQQKKKDSTLMYKEIRNLQEKAAQYAEQLERERDEDDNIFREKTEMEKYLEILHWQKTVLRQNKDLEDRRLRRLEQAESGVRMTFHSAEERSQEKQREEQLSDKIRGVVGELKQRFPQLQDHLDLLVM
mmetsp:Transcript_5691/g.21472  ORF Transcript_5691/g.21472 Transcript_5691/m.21472 type:complete len:911 (-) Transcript_5691:660-3392(-)